MGEAPPEIWTINRVIKRNKLKRQPEKRKSKNHEYPCGDYLNVQQMDFVGPRYITNYGRIYWLNIIDVDTHCVHVNPVKGKAAENVLPCLIRFWQDFGRPDYLQLDNELSFRGSNRYPHSFGEIIKFSLTQKVTVLFIPPREPWRNGVIEKFNDTFDKKFFRKKIFTDYEDMITKAREFEDFHNKYHRYKAIGNKTPIDEFTKNGHKSFLDKNYKLPEQISVDEGEIILVRFIRSDQKLDIFGEKFILPKETVYSYVMAVICIEIHSLKVYLDDKLIAEFRYIITMK